MYSKIAGILANAVVNERDILPQGGVSSTSTSPASLSPKTGASSGLSISHVWLGPLQTHAMRSATDGETFSRFIRETVLPLLERHKDDLRRRGREIRGRLSEATLKLNRYHDALIAAMNLHERGWKVRIKMNNERIPNGSTSMADMIEDDALGEALNTTDVFLTEQNLRQKISGFLEEKTLFCSILMECFRNTRLLEHDLGSALKDILGEAMRVKGQQLAAAAELISECSTATREAEPLSEWTQALRKHRLDWDWSVETPPLDGFTASILTQIGCQLSAPTSASSSVSVVFPYNETALIRPVALTKGGFLMRPNTFGRSWSVVFAVLVDSAFLHLYPANELFGLKEGPLANGQSPKERPFRIPSPTMRLHNKALLELNQMALRLFLDLIHVPERISQPSLSLPLLHPITSVVPEGSRSHEHSFSITVPGGTGFFSRSEKKTTLRSFVEEDMVDWCIALKETIHSRELGKESNVETTTAASSSPPPSQSRNRNGPLNPFGSTIAEEQMAIKREEDDAFRQRAIDEVDKPVALHGIATATSVPTTALENPWDS